MSALDRILWRLPRCAAFVSGAALMAWSAPALANASYPGDVDTALGKPMIVETKIAPTMGCQLCHTNPGGGTMTLTTFANYMIAEYDFPKTTVAEDALVAASLAKLKAAEPKLWADMQAGIDPNTDPVLAEQAPPQPQYGCSSAAAREDGCRWLAVMAGVAAAGLVSGRRLRRP